MKLLSLLSILPASALAASEPASLPSAAGSVFQMLFGLGIVLALLFAALHVLKKLNGPRAAAGALKVLGATAVGPRERVVLVEVADTVLVLGVTNNQITALHSLPAASLPTTTASPASASDFAGRLRQFMEARRDK